MPFFMVDDQLFINRKVKKLTAPVLDGDLHGLAAIGLWTLAGSSVQAALTDGLVSIHDLISKVYDITVARKLAVLLEDAGLWHANGHDCPRCEPVPANHWRFHDWWALGYDRGDVVRETRAKRKEQQDVEMVAAVWARDCIDPAKPGIARCRYCHKTVKRKDTRSDPLDRPTLDHVDPTSAKGVTNLVVACGDCNRRKGKRTPTEADMTLRPAPRTTALAATEPAPVTAGTPVSLTVEQAQAAGVPAAAEITISPTEEPAVTAARTTSGTTSGRPRGNQVVDQAPEGVLGRAHEGAGAGAPGAGSGAGSGVELDVGTHLGEARPSSPSSSSSSRTRRRKRSRGKGGPKRAPAQTRPEPVPVDPMNAGPAPRVPVAGSFGSPWHAYTGPTSPLGDENHCAEHQLPQPCRRCMS